MPCTPDHTHFTSPERPASPKQMPPGVKAAVARQDEAKAKAEEERRAAEAAEADRQTQPRPGAIPSRYVEYANQDEAQIPPWQTYQLSQAQRVLSKVSGIRKRGGA